jgi:UDP-N-acetylglucosamine acyltransferase
VQVGRKAIVSGMVGVHHFVSIGELAFVGAMSGVRFDAPPYVTVEGYPAEPRSVNIVGLRRDGWSPEDIRATKDAFRTLYKDRNGTPLAQIVEQVRQSEDGKRAPVTRLCDWLSENLMHSVKGRVLEASRSC